jgi:acylphosphatase
MRARWRPHWRRCSGGRGGIEMPRLHLAVTGMVQGVGFRWFTREAARRLGLAGWVRNNSDGSVEILVEGSDALLERFIAEVGRGPNGAAVRDVRRTSATAGEALPNPFAIKGRG